MIGIGYHSKDFKPHLGAQFIGRQDLFCTWPEILWAAITVGKANLYDLWRFGQYSWLETAFRTSLVFANLMADRNGRLRKPPTYRLLDPSEKGAVSYFLGITIAKLFAEKLLEVPWLLHLDVYRSFLRLRRRMV